jgi:hypothetical protein
MLALEASVLARCVGLPIGGFKTMVERWTIQRDVMSAIARKQVYVGSAKKLEIPGGSILFGPDLYHQLLLASVGGDW